jgi:hypothetical protein
VLATYLVYVPAFLLAQLLGEYKKCGIYPLSTPRNFKS